MCRPLLLITTGWRCRTLVVVSLLLFDTKKLLIQKDDPGLSGLLGCVLIRWSVVCPLRFSVVLDCAVGIVIFIGSPIFSSRRTDWGDCTNTGFDGSGVVRTMGT